MKLLTKYMIKNHTRLIFMTLAIGISIFILIDLIEKADIFMASKKPIKYALEYYVLKLPFIISQTLPAVFLLASVIFLSVMVSSRESIALQAGGISMYTVTKNLIFIGIFWAAAQFLLSQLVMNEAEQKVLNLWRYEIREWRFVEKSINNLWLTDNDYLVHAGVVYERGKGENLSAYKLSEDSKTIEEIVRAERFFVEKGAWQLENVTLYYPEQFLEKKQDKLLLPIEQNLRFYFISNQEDNPQTLSFFVLGEAIERLRNSGSNIENMLTVWHSKITYSLMIVVFAVLAVAIISYKSNVYLAVILAVVASFVSYVLSTLGVMLGQSGKLPPVFAAWFPCVLLFVSGYAKIYFGFSRR